MMRTLEEAVVGSVGQQNALARYLSGAPEPFYICMLQSLRL